MRCSSWAWRSAWLLAWWLAVPAAAEPLVLAVSRTPLSLPLYVADQEGYFAAEGVPVTLQEVIGGHRTMQALLAGEADLATSSDAVVTFASYRSQAFVLLASFVTSTDDVKLVVGPTSGITGVGDLTGKRVGTILGSASHYYLDTLAVLGGVDPKQLEVVGLQPEDMAAALQRGRVDAISVWQPFAFRAARDVAGARTLEDDGFYALSFNLVAARELVKTREADLERLLRALNRAEAFIAANPKASQKLLRTRLNLDPDYIDWLWGRYRYRLTLEQALVTTLESEARWAREEGHVSAAHSPNYLEFLHSAPLRRVSPNAVGVVE
jgi:ABC-type nitrate/sulfonate/bicarbonate transport system substrate-binding protein